jgi:hypothetical protein
MFSIQYQVRYAEAVLVVGNAEAWAIGRRDAASRPCSCIARNAGHLLRLYAGYGVVKR